MWSDTLFAFNGFLLFLLPSLSLSLISSRHGVHVAVFPVPVHPICNIDRGECAIVHGGQWQPGGTPTWKRLTLSSTVPGLGGGYRGCSGSPFNCVTQPTKPSVFVHLHNLGVLPHPGQAVYNVPDDAAYSRHPPTTSLGREVSKIITRTKILCVCLSGKTVCQIFTRYK